MNAFDFFFENTYSLDKPFLLGKEILTFRDLYSSSIFLAEFIRSKLGVNKNIILLSPNNEFFLTVYLAVIKSGNICIPLDPGIEPENFQYIKDLTCPELIFLTNEVQSKLDVNSDNLILPDDLPAKNNDSKISFQADTFNSERCAEIIFTSGSTGKPKGVMISHKNLIANTTSIVDYLKLDKSDIMLVVLPFYYCYGLSLLHTHLRVGGSIILNNSFIFIGGVINNLLEYKCTGFAGVPSHFQILLRKSETFKKTYFPNLKYVTQAGGKLAPVFIDEFREVHKNVKFIVMYGQTEATARLSWLPPELYELKKGSMGKGIPGVELKVINEKGEMIVPGETGEVIARGDNIMMGYFGDDEATKNAIRDGWLHTGDLGTVDNDGYIYLTARSKEIIKVRGKRISPKEVESVILAIPEVIDCTVEGVEHELQGELLKAIVILTKGSAEKITVSYLKHYCSQHLTLFKIPEIVEIKEELTISPTGKKIKKI